MQQYNVNTKKYYELNEEGMGVYQNYRNPSAMSGLYSAN